MSQPSSRRRTLPLFRAVPEPFDAASHRLLSTLFGVGLVDRVDRDDRVEFVSGTRRLQVNRATSAIWFADNAQLFRSLDPGDQPPPMIPLRATALVNAMAQSFETPWKRVARFHVGRQQLGERSTMVATSSDGPVAVDQYAATQFSITVPNPWDYGDLAIPIAGRTAKMAVTVNRRGDVIGAQYSWWHLEYYGESPVVAPAAHLEALLPDPSAALLDGFSSSLVYQEVEVAAGQWLLMPMWMMTPSAVIDGNRVPLMTSLKPATETPLPPPRPEPTQTRDRGTTMSKSSPPPIGYRAGMSWIGTYGGLGRTYESIARVEEVLRGHGWHIGFDWGNQLAYEDDWHGNNHQWVDAVDLAYFCGHAACDGWTLARPDDFRLTNDDVSASGDKPDLFGSGRLRWIVLDACGPLQDPATGGSETTTAIGRWSGAFDGLRILLGGATTLTADDFVGERFAQLAVETPLIDAWIQANRELRPHLIGLERMHVGSLHAVTAGADARLDTLPVPGNGLPAPPALFPVESVVSTTAAV
jgi:hypothetical protein